MKNKGCLGALLGCSGVLLIAALLLGGILWMGYRNRHEILPAVLERMDMEIAEALESAGTELTGGMPPEYLEKAYELTLQRGIRLQAAIIADPVDQAFARYLDYHRSEGWSLDEELDSLDEAPAQIKAFSGRLDELKAARLIRDGRQMGLAVSSYRGQTIAVQWRPPAVESP